MLGWSQLSATPVTGDMTAPSCLALTANGKSTDKYTYPHINKINIKNKINKLLPQGVNVSPFRYLDLMFFWKCRVNLTLTCWKLKSKHKYARLGVRGPFC